MNIQNLSQAEAFSSGGDLWVCPQTQLASWSTMLNWYLNFQITRAEIHTPQSLSPVFEDLKNQFEFDFQPYQFKDDENVLIASEFLVPVKYVLIAPLSETTKVEAWVKEILQKIENMKVIHIRFFLPIGADTENLQKELAQIDSPLQITLVQGREI